MQVAFSMLSDGNNRSLYSSCSGSTQLWARIVLHWTLKAEEGETHLE